MFENIGPRHGLESSWGYKQMHAIGEQQSKRTHSGSSSRSRCNREAVEADAIGELQLKRTQSGAAAEADAIWEQQLKQTQSGCGR